VQVVTDGSPVAAGQSVRVIQVLGNRVVVAPLD
jgi:membrane-bound ClpP family serine protease